MDLATSILQQASEEGIAVFFYGSTQDVLDRLRVMCIERFPELRIAGMVSPLFARLQKMKMSKLLSKLLNQMLELVFVILGCPKQERWMARMKGRIPAVMIGLGGALLVLAGYQSRAPQWIQNYGLEWFFRLVQEPRRLFKRYATTNSYFIYHFVKQYFKNYIHIKGI